MNEVYVSGKIVKLQRRPVPPDTDRFKFVLQVTHRLPKIRLPLITLLYTLGITLQNGLLKTYNLAMRYW